MNKLARDFKLGNTNFSNVHGLMNKKNYSCSEDLCKLSFLAMQK
jgi:D-alanyl-D-alanine carboxypeptidase